MSIHPTAFPPALNGVQCSDDRSRFSDKSCSSPRRISEGDLRLRQGVPVCNQEPWLQTCAVPACRSVNSASSWPSSLACRSSLTPSIWPYTGLNASTLARRSKTSAGRWRSPDLGRRSHLKPRNEKTPAGSVVLPGSMLLSGLAGSTSRWLPLRQQPSWQPRYRRTGSQRPSSGLL